ncbi:MAG: DUF4367 domain-containing protein [Oscillospiraceae bacterium]|nr:DUF4367 domain-containing protein [Oscillospiraceae bacterium]
MADLFDSVLKQAVIENHAAEMAAIPSEAELAELYTFSDEHNRKMKKLFAADKRKTAVAFALRFSKTATAAAAVIVCVALATNPSVSAFFKDIFVKITSGFNQHEFNDDTIITIENFNHDLRPTYLPEGYRITFAYYSLISMLVEFNDEDFNLISLQYGLANSIAISVDNEHSEPHSILVNGREAVFYESNTEDRPSYFVWNIGGYGFVLSAQIELDEFIEIAESINIF